MSAVTLEHVEVNDDGEALVVTECDGVTIVANVPAEVDRDDLEEAVEEVTRAVVEYVPRFSSVDTVLTYDDETVTEATSEDVARCYDGTTVDGEVSR